MVAAVVQHSTQTSSTSPVPGVAFASNPTAGNLIVAVLIAGANQFNHPCTAANGWTRDSHADFKTGNGQVQIFWRYAVGGDTTYASLSSDTQSLQCGVFAWEVSGVDNTWAAAVDQIQADANNGSISGTQVGTTPALSTTAANELALLGIGGFGYSGSWSFVSGGFTQDDTDLNGFYSGNSGHEFFAGSSSSVQAVLAISNAQPPAYGLILLKSASAGPPTSTIAMTFGGITMALSETGTLPDEIVTVGMTFGPITMALNGLIPTAPGSGLRQFWTF